jgi:hypothetical protein
MEDLVRLFHLVGRPDLIPLLRQAPHAAASMGTTLQSPPEYTTTTHQSNTSTAPSAPTFSAPYAPTSAVPYAPTSSAPYYPPPTAQPASTIPSNPDPVPHPFYPPSMAQPASSIPSHPFPYPHPSHPSPMAAPALSTPFYQAQPWQYSQWTAGPASMYDDNTPVTKFCSLAGTDNMRGTAPAVHHYGQPLWEADACGQVPHNHRQGGSSKPKRRIPCPEVQHPHNHIVTTVHMAQPPPAPLQVPPDLAPSLQFTAAPPAAVPSVIQLPPLPTTTAPTLAAALQLPYVPLAAAPDSTGSIRLPWLPATAVSTPPASVQLPAVPPAAAPAPAAAAHLSAGLPPIPAAPITPAACHVHSQPRVRRAPTVKCRRRHLHTRVVYIKRPRRTPHTVQAMRSRCSPPRTAPTLAPQVAFHAATLTAATNPAAAVQLQAASPTAAPAAAPSGLLLAVPTPAAAIAARSPPRAQRQPTAKRKRWCLRTPVVFVKHPQRTPRGDPASRPTRSASTALHAAPPAAATNPTAAVQLPAVSPVAASPTAAPSVQLPVAALPLSDAQYPLQWHTPALAWVSTVSSLPGQWLAGHTNSLHTCAHGFHSDVPFGPRIWIPP